jgi:hypothetical protein
MPSALWDGHANTLFFHEYVSPNKYSTKSPRQLHTWIFVGWYCAIDGRVSISRGPRGTTWFPPRQLLFVVKDDRASLYRRPQPGPEPKY